MQTVILQVCGERCDPNITSRRCRLCQLLPTWLKRDKRRSNTERMVLYKLYQLFELYVCICRAYEPYMYIHMLYNLYKLWRVHKLYRLCQGWFARKCCQCHYAWPVSVCMVSIILLIISTACGRRPALPSPPPPQHAAAIASTLWSYLLIMFMVRVLQCKRCPSKWSA